MSHPWQVQASARMSSLAQGLQSQMSLPLYQQQQQPNPIFQQQPQPLFQQQPPQLFQQPLAMQQQQQQQLQTADKNKGFNPNAVSYPFQTPSMPPPTQVTLGAGTLNIVSSMQGGMGPTHNSGGHSLMGAPSLPLGNLGSMQSPGAVTYPLPRRGLTTAPPMNVPPPNLVANTNGSDVFTPRTRVFTGTVTKLFDNFGFIDGDVFFQTTVCTGGLQPKLGDRAIVDAAYNASMPFKWNATRIQVLPSANEFAVPAPPDDDRNRVSRQEKRREPRSQRSKEREVEREAEREKRREERQREREREREKEKEKDNKKARSRSPPPRRRSRSRSPPRRHARPVPKYNVNVPKVSLDMSEASLPELRRRYPNLYIPSDFCTTTATWLNAFPSDKPLSLEQSCSFHVMHKEVDPVEINTAVLDPPDADFKFSAKVMLLSLPSIDDMFRKSCALAEDGQDGDLRDGFVHPTRLINFLVGSKGKSDTMAIGGPWSPSLDGPNPDKDPAVLIKTAIRTCRALTGIDLSRCTLWYRFLELHYRRADAHNKQAVKVETVVLFLPDVWSCVPTRLEWDGLQHNYNKQLARITNGVPAEAAAGGKEALRDQGADQKNEKNSESDIKKLEPTHFAQLDPKTMKVGDLRRELEARGVSPKGLTSQLQARLGKILKSEQDTAEEEEAAAVAAAAAAKAKAEAEEKEKILQAAQEREMDPKAAERKKKEEEEKKRQEERERQARERRYQLPSSPHIIVHPSRTAKSGRFDCTVMSLSLLLDYRAEDTKEHSFEVSLFAELFNEMLMRDFGFRIYRSLVKAPEKPKEEEKDRKDSKDKKKEKDDGKDNDTEKDSEDNGDDSSSNSKKKERDRREKVKMVTVDPQLLLSFIYFDQTHCGYIFDRDMEEILHALGLHLSRAQCRRLLQKVLTRDTLAYRKLTDRSEPATGESSSADSAQEDVMNSALAKGNSILLPEFSAACIPPRVHSELHCTTSDSDDDTIPVPSSNIVNWNGTLVNVRQLLAQLKRSQKARRVTEAKIAAIQSEFNNAENRASKSTTKAAELAQTLKKSQDRLRDAEEELRNAKANCSKFQAALEAVKNVLTPVMEETRSMPRKREVSMETSEIKSDEPSLPDKQDSQEEVKMETEDAAPKSE